MKRNKVTTACEACRTKKKKCDGQTPICQPCQDAKTSCNWSRYSGRSSKVSKQYIQDLEAKVRDLEQSQRRNPQPNSEQVGVTNPTEPTPISHLDKDVRADGLHGQHRYSSDQVLSGRPKSEDSKPPGILLKSVSHAIDECLSKRKDFFGTASIGSFIFQVVESLDTNYQTADSVQPFQHTDNARIGNNRRHQPTNKLDINDALPTRRMADSLLSTYWTHSHPIYPFVDRADIELLYDGIWSAKDTGEIDPVYLYILNMIFALSARLSPNIPPKDRNSNAITFVNRAHDTVSCDIWTFGTFRSVQCLLLLGLFNHTSDPHLAWQSINQAVNTAQSLGLHLPQTIERLETLRAQELTRKVWHCCIMMDRILSQTYGRHPMISKKVAGSVPPPLSIDEADLLTGSGPASLTEIRKPNTAEFFVQALHMMEIVADALTQFYSNYSDRSKKNVSDYEWYLADPVEKPILYYEHRLHQWFEDLPEYLKWSDDSTGEDVLTRQANILRQRFLHFRILILRPALRSVVADSKIWDTHPPSSNSSSLHHQLLLQCAISCIRTAQEAIGMILSNSPADPSAVGVVSAWIHNILFLYTPATVLLAARLSTSLSAIVGDESIDRSWRSALGLLEFYETFGQPAKRAIAILLRLDEHVQRKRVNVSGSSIVPVKIMPPSSTTDRTPTSFHHNAIVYAVDSQDRDMFDAQLDHLDLSLFDLEDFSWMEPFKFDT